MIEMFRELNKVEFWKRNINKKSNKNSRSEEVTSWNKNSKGECNSPLDQHKIEIVKRKIRRKYTKWSPERPKSGKYKQGHKDMLKSSNIRIY